MGIRKYTEKLSEIILAGNSNYSTTWAEVNKSSCLGRHCDKMEGIGAAISSVQPTEEASLEPCTHTSYSECLATHLMCCETFTAAAPEPRILDSVSLPHLPDSITQCGVSLVSGSTMAHHLYHQTQEPPPSLHVEVLQHSCSSLSASVVREYAVAQLKMQPTAFGEFTLSEFDDPVLKEHVVSIAVCDVPSSIQVNLSRQIA